LVPFFLLQGLVGVKLSEIPDQKTAPVGGSFSSCEEVVAPNVADSNLISVAFEDPFDLEGDQIPNGDSLLAGSEEETPFRVDHYVFYRGRGL
jgi:hypothetical protein